MNKILTMTISMTVLGCFLALPVVSMAQEKTDEHAGHHPEASAETAAPMQRMQDNMKKMHELMEKIHAAKTPEEKQRLLEQHHGAMHEQMKMMKGMKSEKGAVGGEKGKGGMMDGEMMKHHQAMMHRMDMMQDMMEQMMEHMSAEHHMMRPDPAKKK